MLPEPPTGKTGTGAVTNSSAGAEELIALIDERIKAAVERNEREHLEVVAAVARDALREEFQLVRAFIETKLAQVEALLAQSPPLDQARTERPN